MRSAARSVDRRRAVARARTQSWLVRRNSTVQDHGAGHWLRQWLANHFVFACANVPSDADVATGLADRVVPCWASRSLGNGFRPAASKSAPHRVDHVFACGVLLHESLWRPRPGIRFPILRAGSETNAWVRWLRCPPAPGAEARHKTPALGCLRASVFDSQLTFPPHRNRQTIGILQNRSYETAVKPESQRRRR